MISWRFLTHEKHLQNLVWRWKRFNQQSTINIKEITSESELVTFRVSFHFYFNTILNVVKDISFSVCFVTSHKSIIGNSCWSFTINKNHVPSLTHSITAWSRANLYTIHNRDSWGFFLIHFARGAEFVTLYDDVASVHDIKLFATLRVKWSAMWIEKFLFNFCTHEAARFYVFE